MDSLVNKRVAIKLTFRNNRPRRSVFLRGLLFLLLFITKKRSIVSCACLNYKEHYCRSSFDKEELARSV